MIRDAGPQDREGALPLWIGCLADHGTPFDAAAYLGTWDRAVAGQGLGLRLAGPPGAPLGLALHSWGRNTWTGTEDGYLDTLFVAPAARGGGIAAALLDDLLALGRRRGWASVAWHVAADNAGARALYDRRAGPDGYLRYCTRL